MEQHRGSVRAVFDRALEIKSPGEQKAYLDEACAGRPEWRQEVESLLGAHGRAGDFLERPAVEQVSVAPPAAPDATVTLDADAKERQAASRSERPEPTDTRTGPGGEDEETTLDFLQPSTKPGSLGRLAHYEVLEVLGKGGFGIVLKAFDEKLHRIVALKVMAPHLAATSPARKRFLREARASAAIRHENVVAIYAVDDQPIPYLVMEYIAGKTLQDRLDGNGPLDLKEVLRIARQVADGLAAAHAMGIIHRDIKPANILLESGVDHVKITDFGLARAADDASVTQSGVVAGTPMYMAPEQAMGEALDHRADLFSLGSVMYQMCTGRPPFRASTTFAVLKRVAEDTPRPMREVIPETPEWLCDIVARLHAKKPEDRYATAKEVADLLARYLSELQLHGSVSSPSSRPTPAASRSRRSGRGWMAVAGVCLLLLAGLGVTEVSGVTHLAGAALRLFHPNGEGPPVPEEPPALAIAPFDAKQASAHQEAWAKHLHVPVEVENSIGMKLRLVPPGEFLMGSPDGEVAREAESVPQHAVVITKPFYMGVHDVTVGQFKAFVKEKTYQTEAEQRDGAWRFFPNGEWQNDPNANWRNPGFEQTDDHPVICVSWNDAKAFCEWLSAKEGKHYALPTEAQWEHGCRAGSQTKFYFGDDPQDAAANAWYNENSKLKTHPVGQKKPNSWGLYDMHGNVWQWIADRYAADYYQKSPRQDPPGPSAGDARGLRGGSWGDGWGVLLDASRLGGGHPPSHCTTDAGFRVAVVGDLSQFNPDQPKEKGSRKVPEEPPPLAVAPFDAKQALAHQEAWAKHLHVPVEVENSIGMKLRLIPPGEFLMGSSQEEGDAVLKELEEPSKYWVEWVRSETPQRRVTIEAPFFLGRYEVTVGQFRRFVKETGYRTRAEISGKGGAHWDNEDKKVVTDPQDIWSNARFAPTDDYPVSILTRSDAQAFCDWLAAKEGLRYVLPDEEQWEYACRAGTTGRWYSGDDPAQAVKCSWLEAGATQPVGRKLPNAFGLFDMLGNVNEYVGNPQSPVIQRGGDIYCRPLTCRSASRTITTGEDPWFWSGFRVAVVGDLSKFNPDRSKTTGSRTVPDEPPPLAVAPFDAKQAKAQQEAWAKHLHVPVEAENSIGMVLRLIPPGEFLMGSTQEEVDAVLKATGKDPQWAVRSEAPQHVEKIEEPFFLGAYEVTVGQFRQFVKATGYRTRVEADGKGGLTIDEKGKEINDPNVVWNKAPYAASEEHPVCVLMRPDAQAFCDWLGVKEGVRYMLPDDEQWEYACRAGTTGRWCSGDDPEQVRRFGWFLPETDGLTHPVGSKRPNAFGLFDMHGNVEEYVGQARSPVVLRGGHVGDSSAWYCRSAWRRPVNENEESPWAWRGFRVAVVGDLSKFKQP